MPPRLSRPSELNRPNRFILPVELTAMVFKFLLLSNARDTVARCSRVCRIWYWIAITVLWTHIDLDWFRLLAPFEPTGESLYDSTLSLVGESTARKWELFLRFAKATRSLDFHWNGRPCNLDTFFLDEFAYFRDENPIFPKLRSLSVGIKSFVVSFYPRSLTKLSLDFGSTHVDDYILDRASRSLSFASHRFNSLTVLDIRSATVLEQPLFASALEDCLMQWNTLVSFGCPLYFIRDRELRILGQYPHLMRVGVDVDGAERGFWMSEDRVRTHDHAYLDLLAFSQLRCLEIGTAGLPALRSLLSPLHLLLSQLETLWVRAPYPLQCQPSHLHDLLELLSDHSPNLRRLTLRLAASHTWNPKTEDDIRVVEWQHLQSITKMRLEVIDLFYTLPFRITDANIEEFAASQPEAISIVLNPQPIFIHSSYLTIASVEAFARFCPKLQSLALYIDAETVIPRSLPTSQFRSLEHLRMGHSNIVDGDVRDCENWIQLVTFFHHILPSTTKIWSTYYDQRRDLVDGFTFIGQRHYDIYTYGRRWKSLYLCTRCMPSHHDEDVQLHGGNE
ncbi:uncharacterized protein STEHIDRAFT_112896 [Stereum hirsutum FP-91666 SS1]|uniref:uncharacterized protein n=1 Tax=Stereum hirsutum (strain FP-91666) TaxID=721885 RepID=UPI000444A16F|nr:uncharacterized protein STEHIDRAFT_112896 [Stereum hirsutum FP-91666 SS1]EIM84551.1 hypothetical protein STEHIDRAFT_112896 [Stereum hirsutum FP-91666 SS1]